jgi:hypothetical protein
MSDDSGGILRASEGEPCRNTHGRSDQDAEQRGHQIRLVGHEEDDAGSPAVSARR